jgi:hypothetical protein
MFSKNFLTPIFLRLNYSRLLIKSLPHKTPLDFQGVDLDNFKKSHIFYNQYFEYTKLFSDPRSLLSPLLQIKFLSQDHKKIAILEYQDCNLRDSKMISYQQRTNQETLDSLTFQQSQAVHLAFDCLKNPAKYLQDFESELEKSFKKFDLKLSNFIFYQHCQSPHNQVPIPNDSEEIDHLKIDIFNKLVKKIAYEKFSQSLLPEFHGTVDNHEAIAVIKKANFFIEDPQIEDMIIHGSYTHILQLLAIENCFRQNFCEISINEFVDLILEKDLWNPLLDAVARYNNSFGGKDDYTNPHAFHCAILNRDLSGIDHIADCIASFYLAEFLKLKNKLILPSDKSLFSETSKEDLSQKIIEQMIYASFYRKENDYPIIITKKLEKLTAEGMVDEQSNLEKSSYVTNIFPPHRTVYKTNSKKLKAISHEVKESYGQ